MKVPAQANRDLHAPTNGGIETSVTVASGRLRERLTEALFSIGATPDKPQQLGRQVGLDKSLAWKISRFLTEPDVTLATRHLPGKPGQRILISALQESGVAATHVALIQEALGGLDRVVEVHAGDRESFDLMMAAMRPASLPDQEEQLRRQAFIGASAIWGVQARVQLSIHIMVPSRDGGIAGGKIDFATVSGFIDFRRLRGNTPWAVARLRRYDGAGSPEDVSGVVPMDAACGGGPGEAPLLQSFCSQPLPPLLVRGESGGVVRYELEAGPVGNDGALTCLTGWNNFAMAGRWATEHDQFGENTVSLSTPAEVAFHELYVHRELTFAHNPSIHLYSQMPGGPRYPADGRDRGLLPASSAIISLGAYPPSIATAEVPRHREIVEAAALSVSASLNDLVGFRYKLRYPPIPTMAVFRNRLDPRER